MRTPIRIRCRPIAILAFALAVLQCQSPTENPASVVRRVVVHVQDSLLLPLPTMPVALYGGTIRNHGATPLETQITNKGGDALFDISIPVTGASYTFIAGDDNTGRMQVEALLLCRDSLVVITFSIKRLACSEQRADTVRLENICVYPGGKSSSDSTQLFYRSGCDVPLVFSFTPLEDPFRLRLFAVDGNGVAIQGNSFTVPAYGSFSLMALASPIDTGRIVRTVTLTGTGAGGANQTISLTIIGSAVSCLGCPCNDTTIVMSLGNVQAKPDPQKTIKTLVFFPNLGYCVGNDVITKLPGGDPFSLISGVRSIVLPGEFQQLAIQFAPKDAVDYSDTIRVQRFIKETNKTCTATIILHASGCAPQCCILPDNLRDSIPDVYVMTLHAKVYASDGKTFCFSNCGSCGALTVTQNLKSPQGGFTVSPQSITMGAGETNCFSVQFNALDSIVWPNGHGRPAQTAFSVNIPVTGCNANKTVRVIATVDTIPIRYSRCIYEWKDNGYLGFDFTPPELKGSEIFDGDPLKTQLTDLVVWAVTPGVNADALIRSGWLFIRANVTEAEFDFLNIASTWLQYPLITFGPFNTTQTATFDLGSCYSIRIERNGKYSYALIRIREISVDADNKHKICFDVLYPMI